MYNIIKVTVTMYLFMQISTIILTLYEQQCKLTILHVTGLALFLCNVNLYISHSHQQRRRQQQQQTTKIVISQIEDQWNIVAVIFPNTIINVRLTTKSKTC